MTYAVLKKKMCTYILHHKKHKAVFGGWCFWLLNFFDVVLLLNFQTCVCLSEPIMLTCAITHF